MAIYCICASSSLQPEHVYANEWIDRFDMGKMISHKATRINELGNVS